MIAIDTNVLVYAHRRDISFHAAARETLYELAVSGRSWAIPLHCAVEFYGVVTHPGIWNIPSTPAQAADQIRAWQDCPTLAILGDHERTLERLLAIADEAHIKGPKVHDARIAALCLSHGVAELWTVDRDFSRFGALRTRNPL